MSSTMPRVFIRAATVKLNRLDDFVSNLVDTNAGIILAAVAITIMASVMPLQGDAQSITQSSN